MPARMAAVDAQFYWMSAMIRSDQFLLYAFADEPADFDRAVDEVRARAQACPHLTMRVDDGSPVTYPRWVPTAVGPAQLRRHRLDDDSWRGCLDAVVRLAGDQLSVRRAPWRLHLFAPVRGIPGSTGAGVVAVLQVAHALADGALASALAGWLFDRTTPVPEVTPLSPGFLPWRALAARTHRELVQDMETGLLGHPVGSRPPLVTNARPAGPRAVRTLVRHRSQLPGPTVTVAVLAAISGARAASGRFRGFVAPRYRWPNPVYAKHIITSATSPWGCIRTCRGGNGSSGSPRTWPTVVAAPSTRLHARPTGRSPRCPPRCCVGV
jgi:hypothetical protein